MELSVWSAQKIWQVELIELSVWKDLNCKLYWVSQTFTFTSVCSEVKCTHAALLHSPHHCTFKLWTDLIENNCFLYTLVLSLCWFMQPNTAQWIWCERVLLVCWSFVCDKQLQQNSLGFPCFCSLFAAICGFYMHAIYAHMAPVRAGFLMVTTDVLYTLHQKSMAVYEYRDSVVTLLTGSA